MNPISAKKFSIEISDSSECLARASRRIVINAEQLKAAKLFTGDIIAISPWDSSSKVRNKTLNFGYP